MYTFRIALIGVYTFVFGILTVFADSTASSELLAPKLQAIPLAFEPNLGQAGRHARFLARGSGYSLLLAEDEAILALGSHEATVRLQWIGSRRNVPITGQDRLPGLSNYIIGNDPARWRTGIPQYRQVKCRGIYRGIDVVYYGNQRQFEYDLVLSPGVDPRKIRLRILGADKIRISPQGDLVLTIPGGEIFQKLPFIYQAENSSRRHIPGKYVLLAANEVGFSIPSYDSRKSIVVDPMLSYATYLGGSANDSARAIAIDGSGNAYIAGETISTNFPTAGSPPYQSARSGSTDAFVAKLNASGTALLYSTYLGGSSSQVARAIAVDSNGSAYIAGNTSSTDFPVTPGAFVTSRSQFVETGFVSKLNSTGASLAYSTYIGTGSGNNDTYVYGIAVDTAGCAYIAGETGDWGLPTSPTAFQPSLNYYNDAFVFKLNAQGTGAVYGTYLGGHEYDGAYGIALDSSGNAYIAGHTVSTNFPTQNPIQASRPTSLSWEDCGFVAKLNADASALIYSTYLGGVAWTAANAIATDSSGNAYVTGVTNPPTSGPDVFPLLNPLQSTRAGGADAFLTKFTPAGALVYSTYLGGSGEDAGLAIGVRSGNAYVAGKTFSYDFPIAHASQPFLTGSDRPAFKSLDAGTNWTSGSAGEGIGIITSMAINPVTPSTLYAGTYTGRVYRSTDGGGHWVRSGTGLPFAEISSLAIAASSTNILYAGTKVGVFKSTNSGGNWFSRVTSGMDDLTVNAVAVDPTNADIVYAATGSGTHGSIFLSSGGGAWWVKVVDYTEAYFTSLVVHPTTLQYIYSGSSDGYLFCTFDGFTQYVYKYNPNDDVNRVSALAIDTAADTIYMAVDTRDRSGYPDLRLIRRTTALECPWNPCDVYHYDGKGPGLSVAVSSSGNTYVGTPTTIEGVTNTAGFAGPFKVIAADPSASNTVYIGNPGAPDVFLSIVNSTGSLLTSSTFFGGSSADEGRGLALDAAGRILLAGVTSSSDFPATAGVYQTTMHGGSDSFVAEFRKPTQGLTSDFEGSGSDNLAVFRSTSGYWYSRSNVNPNTYKSVQWGLQSDIPVPADYNGDGTTDIAVWRPEGSVWYVLQSTVPATYFAAQWGLQSDVPVPADYDGDGKADIAVWRPGSNVWYILLSGTPGSYLSTQWGISTDVPVPADYDGDGKADIAVWRPDTGVWYALLSGTPGSYTAAPWGMNADNPVPGDYDGDGKADVAVWRPADSVWYVRLSGTPGSYVSTQWGLASDIPASGDYDADGKTDRAIWRPGTGVWYVLLSGSPGSYTATQWGMNGDTPISSNALILRSLP
jgi:hypothetical protein